MLSRTRRAGEKINIGGLLLNTLKKLNGDKLGVPFSSIVLANAIGLGDTAVCKYPCNLAGASSLGLILNISLVFLANIIQNALFFTIQK